MVKTPGKEERINPKGRLADSLSPYLRSHAGNPVDWLPWGREALDRARFEDKPLLLSIGYSACHWCHVMARETFEDDEIAAIMNQWFVPVKIDREERPDLDMVYMQAVQILSGRGGWPLHCFALPDGRPFLGGTYFPKERWQSLLAMVHDLWETDRGRLAAAAEAVSRGVARAELSIIGEPGREASEADIAGSLRKSYENLAAELDGVFGGFQGAPKFPMPGLLASLLEYAELRGEASAREHANLTLRNIIAGGIHDHVGGGFARYTVDAEWRVPHFEKMLYDNAGLIEALAKAYLRDPLSLYRKTARRAFDFCRRELLSSEGGFYSSLDADSEGEEGKYYTWTLGEILTALAGVPAADAEGWLRRFSITPEGNWEGGRNIPFVGPAEADEGPSASENSVDALTERIFAIRSRRVPPALDDKVLTSWNALMIKALAWAYLAFQDRDYLDTAREAALFIEDKLLRPDGRLFAVRSRGSSAVTAFAADYAFLADALLDLYETTFENRWRDRAEALCRRLIDDFSDDGSPLFLFGAPDEELPLFTTKTEIVDNVIPSSNAAAADVLLRLGRLLGRDEYTRRAEAMLESVKNVIPRGYANFYRWVSVMMKNSARPLRVSAAGPRAAEYLLAVKRSWIPEAVFAADEAPAEDLQPRPAFPAADEKSEATRIVVCRGTVCLKPAASPREALESIRAEKMPL